MESFNKDWLGTGSINVLGSPMAGKKGRCAKLAEWFGAGRVEGGEILRSTELDPRVKALMEAGDLIPAEDYLGIVVPYLEDQRFAGRPLILDSVGRMDGEQQTVMLAADKAGHPIKCAILLDIDQDTARERHRRELEKDTRGNRADDDPDAFENRLEEFAQKTRPVIEFYADLGLLITIDATRTPAQINLDMTECLYAFAVANQ